MSFISHIAAAVPHRWIMRVAALQYRFPAVKPLLNAVANQFRHRDSVMRNGLGRGLRFNPGGSIAGYALGNPEPDLQEALQILTRPGMVVYDIGANVGFFSVLLAKLVGPEGAVYSFEPLPENADRIAYNARLNHFHHIHVEQAAIGDGEGTTLFNVSDFSTTGRLKSVGNVGVLKSELPVPQRSIDRLIFTKGLPVPALIKIDTEGAETAILAGARRTLTELRPILLIELHHTNEQVADELERHHYQAHVLERDQPIRHAHWNSRVIALPKERKDAPGLIQQLTKACRME